MSKIKHTVELVYFKPSGKYYSEGSYQTEQETIYDIWKELDELLKTEWPGLIAPGSKENNLVPNIHFQNIHHISHYLSDFYILVNVPTHTFNVPKFIICLQKDETL